MATPIKLVNHSQFVVDLKAAHKGFGPFKLRGRNANRKRFYPETDDDLRYGVNKRYLMKSRYQQDLPTKFVTDLAFYGNVTVLNAVANIYKKNGINVFYNV